MPAAYLNAVYNFSLWNFLIILQFAAWVDAVIFVFSLENEASFNAVYNYYTKMSHFRNSAEIPIILVGTQGKSINPASYPNSPFKGTIFKF